MITTILIVAGLAIAALLIFAATRPDTFAVQRSARIQAAPERLFSMINDLHQFNIWNPYNRKDPSMQGNYRGPAAGPGAAYDFEGNRQAGKGSIEIVGSEPRKVTMRLDMQKPMEGHNMVEFRLVPQGDATEVTWAMHGASPFIAKLAGIFMNMDHMIGRDFEAGLANLKVQAERA
jgi:Polyketide cyclase / dehydrase and lipid transport